MTPPPWMRASASPEKSSHSRGLRGSHSDGSSGATIVPWICTINHTDRSPSPHHNAFYAYDCDCLLELN